MRKFVASLLLAAALLLYPKPPVADSNGITIHIQSDTISQQDLQAVAYAIQIQVSRDLFPAWGVNATVTTIDVPGAWQVFVMAKQPEEAAGCLCYGYHEYVLPDGSSQYSIPVLVQNVKGPIGYVFLDQGTDDHSWTITASHEILEMLTDPDLTRTTQINGKTVLIEVGDAVHNETYTINGIVVSDFLYPAYFIPGEKGPYDFLHYLSGGYPNNDE